MLASPFRRLLNDLRRRLGDPAPSSDGVLLGRFVEEQSQDAFATLVQRHGPLVWGVCVRTLRNDADAEDAFQATFVVLARKAATLTRNASLTGWLYGVALRVSRQARRGRLRRQKHEEGLQAMATSSTQADELREVLDEELARMPEKYRLPIVLCHLHGASREEAAQQLGSTEGQVKGNLERGRELLRQRLTKRGLALSAAALTAVLAENAGAVPPPRVVDLALKAALEGVASDAVLALSKGALSAMFWSRVKVVSLVVLLFGLVGGAGLAVRSWQASAVAYVPLPTEKPMIDLASRPAVKDGLSVIVTPARRKFLATEPLEFLVTFKNVSNKPFQLIDPNDYWSWGFVFTDPKDVGSLKTIPVWLLVDRAEPRLRQSGIAELAPGKSTTVKVKLDRAQHQFDFVLTHTNRPPQAALPAGRHSFTLGVKFAAPAPRRPITAAPLWIGAVTTNPVEIEIVEPKAVVKDGLSVSVRPAKPVFATTELLEFIVTFKNVSDKPFALASPGYFRGWQHRFKDLKHPNTVYWSHVLFRRGLERIESTELKPGAEISTHVRFDPLDRQIGFSIGGALRDPMTSLPAGRYAYLTTITFNADPNSKLNVPNWTGKLTTEAVSFEIADADKAFLEKAQQAATTFARARNWDAELVKQAGGKPFDVQAAVSKTGKPLTVTFLWFGNGKDGGRCLFVQVDSRTGEVLDVNGRAAAK